MSLYRSLHPPGSLHRRGYRKGHAIHKAAMKESMAAGLLIEAGWMDKVNEIKATPPSSSSSSSSRPTTLQMIDPMCGSGSLCLEAAMMAADIAPGLMRIRCGLENHSMPPVTRWKSTTELSVDGDDTMRTWKEIVLDATQRAKQGIQLLRQEPQRIKIWGNDIHDGALDMTESSFSSAGLASFVKLTNEDCYDLDIASKDQRDDSQVFVATNPPWGVRLTDDVAESWEGLRHFIRDTCPSGTEVWILSGDKSATATLKLKRDRMIPIQTGDQHLRWIRYTIRDQMDDEDDIPSHSTSHQVIETAEDDELHKNQSENWQKVHTKKKKPTPETASKKLMQQNEWI